MEAKGRVCDPQLASIKTSSWAPTKQMAIRWPVASSSNTNKLKCGDCQRPGGELHSQTAGVGCLEATRQLPGQDLKESGRIDIGMKIHIPNENFAQMHLNRVEYKARRVFNFWIPLNFNPDRPLIGKANCKSPSATLCFGFVTLEVEPFIFNQIFQWQHFSRKFLVKTTASRPLAGSSCRLLTYCLLGWCRSDLIVLACETNWHLGGPNSSDFVIRLNLFKSTWINFRWLF